MRKLIILVLTLAILYGGYWFIGRSQIQSRLNEALVQVDAGDFDLSYDSLHTRGFPSRFDTTITNLEFNDPATAITWSAPFLQLFALSYRPNEVIAVFPNEQNVAVNGEVFTLFTNDMRASGKVRPNAALDIQTATIEIENPRIRTANGAELAMARLLAAMQLTPDTTRIYDAYVEARAIVLPETIRSLIDPGNLQPPIIQILRLDSDVELTEPLALNGSTDASLIETLGIRELAFEWGDISLSAIGDLTPDSTGLIDGSITISVRNWQQALNLAVAAGAVPEERRQFFLGIINTLDETPHIMDTLTATLTIKSGQMALGPLPLGPAPRLR